MAHHVLMLLLVTQIRAFLRNAQFAEVLHSSFQDIRITIIMVNTSSQAQFIKEMAVSIISFIKAKQTNGLCNLQSHRQNGEQTPMPEVKTQQRQ